MNTTVSAADRAKPISWVTTTIVMPSAPRSAISARMPLTSSGSSADVASSKNITCGAIASARAIATRCCWPPDSVAGRTSALCRKPTRSNCASASSRAAPADSLLSLRGAQRDVVDHAAVREQVELLEHHADPLPQFVGIVVQHRSAVEQDVAAVGFVEPVERAQQRRLAGPGWSDHRHGAACRRVDVDTAQHRILPEATGEYPCRPTRPARTGACGHRYTISWR